MDGLEQITRIFVVNVQDIIAKDMIHLFLEVSRALLLLIVRVMDFIC